MADITRDESVEVVLIDGAGTNEAVINSDGSVPISFPERTALNAGKMFGFAIEQNQASTDERNLVLFRNPSGSGKTVYVSSVNIGSPDSITRFRVRLRQSPTVTATGTAATISSRQVKASPPSSVCLVYTVPTTSASGILIRTYTQADTGSKWERFNFGLSVAEGYDLLFTGDVDATNKVIAISMDWSEE